MAEFKRRESRSGGRFKGKKSFDRENYRGRDSSSSRFRGKESSERASFQATCDKCGKQCTLPFNPTSGKPVYCRECFRKGDNEETSSNSNQPANLKNINEKLDKILRAMNID